MNKKKEQFIEKYASFFDRYFQRCIQNLDEFSSVKKKETVRNTSFKEISVLFINK